MADKRTKHLFELRKDLIKESNASGLEKIEQLQNYDIPKAQKISSVAGKVAWALLSIGVASVFLGITPVSVALIGSGALAAYDSAYAKYKEEEMKTEVAKIGEQITNNDVRLGVIDELNASFVSSREVDYSLVDNKRDVLSKVDIDILPGPNASSAEVDAYYEQRAYMDTIVKKASELVDENGNPWIPQTETVTTETTKLQSGVGADATDANTLDNSFGGQQ